MELKPYQQQVLNDLSLYLDYVQRDKNAREAFLDFWVQHPRTPLQPFVSTAVEPYKDEVPKTPHVCVKVPTAGGKTFIACNALRVIFNAFDTAKPQAVVWLVPSITILQQTLKNLQNPQHPYRKKINTLFNNRVEVFDKQTLLQGAGFNAVSVKEQLSIMVFSYDSLRTSNKDGRKVFQENGNLQSFETLLGNDSEITLGRVMQYLNPVVIVDESHNAESELSVDMLKDINPSFILDLTATPRKKSNIIAFVDAMELKRENMVKLPVIVRNNTDKTEVVNSALQLRKHLEDLALAEQKNGGRYIRPIILFQVQPKNGKEFLSDSEEKTNVQKLKEKLIEFQIPEEQIKIKTAKLNEISGVDLMSETCPVRYIITINALKEGWDCPFAYILASLADRSSAIDVEQILGRVLRQPYVMRHKEPMLNMCYVLTSSAIFTQTLENIVKGLNRAGFSDKDYKVAGTATEVKLPPDDPQLPIELPLEPLPTHEETVASDIDVQRSIEPSKNTVAEIEKQALTEDAQYTSQNNDNADEITPSEIQPLVNKCTIKNAYKQQAKTITLPQFYMRIEANELFEQGEKDILLDEDSLLEDFQLQKQDTNIDFANMNDDLYKVDLDGTKKEHTPTYIRLDGVSKDKILEYMLAPSQKERRVKNFTARIMSIIGNMYPIPDKRIEQYLNRILEDFNDAQFVDLARNEYTYTSKIRKKIEMLAQKYAEEQFGKLLTTNKIFIKNSFKLPEQIMPGNNTINGITKSLYEYEGAMNKFELEVINKVANLDCVLFWHRNLERGKGFCINGFINHYPDFIVQMKSGTIVIVETKGDHLDGSDSQQKLRLGNAWASHAGNNYRYFMVFETAKIAGALSVDGLINILTNMN